MKNDIRKKYKLIRDLVYNKEQKSKQIKQSLMNFSEYKDSKIIALYNSFLSEVDTSSIIIESLKIGKTIALPKVVGKELIFYKIDSINNSFEKSKFGIEEPIENKENEISKKDIDLIIVPGICFDENRNRLGYGGGYYDRFLKDAQCFKIGICFEEQIFKGMLPVEENDIKMDKIVTNKRRI